MAEVALYGLSQIDFAHQGAVDISDKVASWDEAADLSQDSQVTDGVKNVQLFERIRSLFKDIDCLFLINLQIDLFRNLEFVLIGPNGLEPFNNHRIFVVSENGLAELDHLELPDESHEGQDHVNDGNFIVDIEEDVDVLLDVLYDAFQQIL